MRFSSPTVAAPNGFASAAESRTKVLLAESTLPFDATGSTMPSLTLFNESCRACSRCISRSERSEEHTSELQSRENLVCRLLLEKRKNYIYKKSRFTNHHSLRIYKRMSNSLITY